MTRGRSVRVPVKDNPSLDASCEAELLQAWSVSRRMSKTANDDPGLIAPEGDKITDSLEPNAYRAH